MRVPDRRKAPPEKQRDRLTLDGWRSRNCSSGCERSEDSITVDPIQRWEAWLWAERNRFDIQRRQLPRDAEGWLRGGGFGGARLDKDKAEKLLLAGFAAIDRESAI